MRDVHHSTSSAPTAPSPEVARVRDPERRTRILRAAEQLFADRGYNGVSMADVGRAAGIVGSGVYRHFDSKAAVLVALFDEVMERLLQTTPTGPGAPARGVQQVLDDLVQGQIRFAVDDRRLLQLYQRELPSLPQADRSRLRRLQRHYMVEWVHVLRDIRPELTEEEARTLVHSAVGAVQSAVSYESTLPRAVLVRLLTVAAHACLGAPVRPGG